MTNYLSANISYSDAQNEWSNIGADGSALVIQQEPRHYGLYDWLKTLSVSDVSVNGLGGVTYTPGSGATNDEIYKTWLAFTNTSGASPIPRLLRFPDEDFVLDDGNGNGFEGDGTNVRINLEDNQIRKAVTAQAAWWTEFDIPGLSNPYYDNDNARRKICAQAIVDLMELERYIRNKDELAAGESNLVGMVIRDDIQAIAEAGSVLPDQAKYAAVEQAYWCADAYLNTDFWPWINENMSSKGMCGLCVIWRLLEDLGMDGSQKETIGDTVKDALYDDNAWDGTSLSANPNDDTYGHHADTTDGPGSGIPIAGLVRPDGGWIENGGCQGTYNGIPMHYLLEGYGFVEPYPEWDFFKEMTRRFFTRANYEAVFDYGDRISAPSMHANREMNPITNEQSPNAGKYALAVQWFGEDAYPWIGDLTTRIYNGDQGPDTAVPPSVSDMENELDNNIGSISFGEMSSQLRDWALESRWGPRHGGIAYMHYEAGTYNDIDTAVQNNNSKRKILARRDGETYTRIKKDIFYHKGEDPDGREFGATVELPLWPGLWSEGLQGLNSFWIEGAGVLIQNMKPHYVWNNVDGRPEVELPIELSNGDSWSFEAKDDGGPNTNPLLSRTSGSDWLEKEHEENGVINRTRVETKSDGIRMINELRPVPGSSFEWTDGKYILPIFRGRGAYTWDSDTNSDSVFNEYEGPRTLIEYWTGSLWSTLTTTQQNSQFIRLSRDLGNGRIYGYLVLDQPRDISMNHSKDYHQRNAFQGNSFRHRDLEIVWHPNPGNAETVNGTTQLNYTLQTSDPTSFNLRAEGIGVATGNVDISADSNFSASGTASASGDSQITVIDTLQKTLSASAIATASGDALLNVPTKSFGNLAAKGKGTSDGATLLTRERGFVSEGATALSGDSGFRFAITLIAEGEGKALGDATIKRAAGSRTVFLRASMETEGGFGEGFGDGFDNLTFKPIELRAEISG